MVNGRSPSDPLEIGNIFNNCFIESCNNGNDAKKCLKNTNA